MSDAGLDFHLGEMADAIRETTERFARDKIAPIAAEIDETDEFPRQLWPQMGELGLHGITVEEEYGPVMVHSLAKETGGATIDLPNSEQDLYDASPKGRERLSEELAWLYDLMTHFHMVDAAAPQGSTEPSAWHWQVVDTNGHERKGLTLMYPRKAPPCSP